MLFGRERICVVIAERTAAAALKALRRTMAFPDGASSKTVELRLDWLSSSREIDRLMARLHVDRKKVCVIATLRRRAAGGKYSGGLREQMSSAAPCCGSRMRVVRRRSGIRRAALECRRPERIAAGWRASDDFVSTIFARHRAIWAQSYVDCNAAAAMPSKSRRRHALSATASACWQRRGDSATWLPSRWAKQDCPRVFSRCAPEARWRMRQRIRPPRRDNFPSQRCADCTAPKNWIGERECMA